MLFQYSLCRVVLMVGKRGTGAAGAAVFQYSLCRVVLMVRQHILRQYEKDGSFSTRSVESF